MRSAFSVVDRYKCVQLLKSLWLNNVRYSALITNHNKWRSFLVGAVNFSTAIRGGGRYVLLSMIPIAQHSEMYVQDGLSPRGERYMADLEKFKDFLQTEIILFQ